MTPLIEQLEYSKIKMNWNKNPIPMNKMLSFLKVGVERNSNCLGSYNGWTEFFNKDLKLILSGGVVSGTNYLDSIQYGVKLQNKYNNYCNPFYLSDIMTDEGINFFKDYYKEDIDKIINDKVLEITRLESKLNEEKDNLMTLQADSLIIIR